MGASRWLRLLLCACLVVLLALDAEAQKKGKGRGKPAGQRPAAGARPGGKGNAPQQIIPGFDTPAGTGAKGKRPVGPKGKGAGTAKGKAAPSAPPDPMKEADRVAAQAEAMNELQGAEEKRLKELFTLCDLDQNGWISLREAELVLSFDRAEYRRADADQDGRLVPREFSGQKTLVFARLGAPPSDERTPASKTDAPAPRATSPKAATDAAPAPRPETPTETTAAGHDPRRRAGARAEKKAQPEIFPRPADLLTRYDRDTSHTLGVEEVERLLVDLGLDFSAPLVLAQMDGNDDGELASGELFTLALLASRHMPEALRPPPSREAEGPASEPTAAPETSAEQTPAAPAATPGTGLAAMTPFGRLDRDRSGFVDEADLRAMQGLARLDARLGALLTALDSDGDRRLSRAEFERAMSAPDTGGR